MRLTGCSPIWWTSRGLSTSRGGARFVSTTSSASESSSRRSSAWLPERSTTSTSFLADQRTQELDLEIAGQGGERPHPQGAPRAARLLHHGREVIRRAENRVGMVERDAPGLGQDEATPAALEQVMAQGGLERLDLGRQGRLRQVEPPGSAGERALCRNRPEQLEVMQVHDCSIQ